MPAGGLHDPGEPRGDNLMSLRGHMQAVRSDIVRIVTGAAGDEGRAVARRQLAAERIPILVEEAAEDGFDMAGTQSREERFEGGGARFGRGARGESVGTPPPACRPPA